MTDEANLAAGSFGLAPLKREGEAIWIDPETMYQWREAAKPRPWITRATEFPRRKTARALERLARFICKDTDEGW